MLFSNTFFGKKQRELKGSKPAESLAPLLCGGIRRRLDNPSAALARQAGEPCAPKNACIRQLLCDTIVLVTSMILEEEATRLRRLLSALTRQTQVLEKTEVGCCGITLSQCHLLLEVSRWSEGQSLSDLAFALGLDLSTVSRVADALVRQELLRREVNPSDRRRVALSATEAGRELAARINREMDRYLHAVLAAIPPEKRSVVLEGLELLAGAIDKVKEKGGFCCE